MCRSAESQFFEPIFDAADVSWSNFCMRNHPKNLETFEVNRGLSLVGKGGAFYRRLCMAHLCCPGQHLSCPGQHLSCPASTVLELNILGCTLLDSITIIIKHTFKIRDPKKFEFRTTTTKQQHCEHNSFHHQTIESTIIYMKLTLPPSLMISMQIQYYY